MASEGSSKPAGSSEDSGMGLPDGDFDHLLPVFKFYASLAELGVVSTFIEHGVFDAIPESGDISLEELGQKAKAESGLLERFSALLVSIGILTSPSPGRVAHTKQSNAYRNKKPAAMLTLHAFDFTMVPIAHWPEYFRKNGLTEPKKANNVPIGVALKQPDKTFYELLETMPERTEVFNSTMQVATAGMPPAGMYDFKFVGDAASADPDRTLLVDVGGGKGQALKAIFDETPSIPPSRCVLFDRPEVIADAEKENDEQLRPVRKVGGSFHVEQPIKGALVYHIRRVLNDWPDDDVVNILKHVRAQCAPDSRVLINEQLLPDPMTAFIAVLDIFFMSLGGKRRNERMYGEIAEKAGFKISKTFKDNVNKTDTTVIELVPV